MKKIILVLIVFFSCVAILAYYNQQLSYKMAAKGKAATFYKEALAAIKEPFNEEVLTEKSMDMGIVGLKAFTHYREKRLKAFCKYNEAIEEEWKKFLVSRKEELGTLCKAGVCPYSELLLGKEEVAAYKGEKNMSGTFPGIEQYLEKVGKEYAKFEKAKNVFYQNYKKTDAKALEAMRQQIKKVDQSEKGKGV